MPGERDVVSFLEMRNTLEIDRRPLQNCSFLFSFRRLERKRSALKRLNLGEETVRDIVTGG